MSKKSLRAAIYLHERLLDGSYGESYGDLSCDDRKPLFNAELLKIEPKLSCCPFCGSSPTYNPSYSDGCGANGISHTASISCEVCDLEFKGEHLNLIGSWENRVNE